MSLHIVRWVGDELSEDGADPTMVYHGMCAWTLARELEKVYPYPTVDDIMVLAFLADPEGNAFSDEDKNFREFSIENKSYTAPARIEGAVGNVCEEIASVYYDDSVSGRDDTTTMSEFYAALLLHSIRPWASANTLVASLVYNWLNRSLDQPKPVRSTPLGSVWDAYLGIA